MKKVILCGYMASGKTTTAKLLSKKANLNYIDLDEVIEKNTGKTISKLFEEDGEIKFRKLEHQTLTTIVNESESFVLSLGGGTPVYANNHLVMQRDDVVSVYLKTGIGEIVNRLKAQKGQRPLLDALKEEELDEFIGQHLFERSYYYHQAKHVVATDGKSPDEVVNEIMKLI
ncbi:shikimate kinase [Flavobacterium sp. AG291]|uniref:shikimate kinase n=1 Tax=Flavobacterium sp. AG291 TaxID=2184000 RepID=UPI000E2A4223|nr:shikimate kinase [Flavobacterium sp. AG291]RDI11094.1 shikimate kinase [Flavobacterium sp. AG291]